MRRNGTQSGPAAYTPLSFTYSCSLPCDPPHPRASASTVVPSHFRRGSLLPLYPTLGGQLYAIAREYGLPSVGGLAIFLVDDGEGNLGPRVGDAAWASLWARYFDNDEAQSYSSESTSDLPPRANPPEEFAPSPFAQPSDWRGFPSLSQFGRDEVEGYASAGSEERQMGHRRQNTGSRQSPMPYATPSGFSPGHLARTWSNRTERVAGGRPSVGRANGSSSSFLAGRLPIVGKIEWAVDKNRARWWDRWVGEAEASAVRSPSRSVRSARKSMFLQQSRDPERASRHALLSSADDQADTSLSGSEEQARPSSSAAESTSLPASRSIRTSARHSLIDHEADTRSTSREAQPLSAKDEGTGEALDFPTRPTSVSQSRTSQRHRATLGVEPVDAERRSMQSFGGESYAGYSALLDDDEDHEDNQDPDREKSVRSSAAPWNPRMSGVSRSGRSHADPLHGMFESDEGMWRDLQEAPKSSPRNAEMDAVHHRLSTRSFGTRCSGERALSPNAVGRSPQDVPPRSGRSSAVHDWISQTARSPQIEEDDGILPPQDDIKDVVSLWASKVAPAPPVEEESEAATLSLAEPNSKSLLSPIALDAPTFGGPMPSNLSHSTSAEDLPSPSGSFGTRKPRAAGLMSPNKIVAPPSPSSLQLPRSPGKPVSRRSSGDVSDSLGDLERALELLSPVTGGGGASSVVGSPQLPGVGGMAIERMSSRDSFAAAKALSTSVTPSPRWLSRASGGRSGRRSTSNGRHPSSRPASASASTFADNVPLSSSSLLARVGDIPGYSRDDDTQGSDPETRGQGPQAAVDALNGNMRSTFSTQGSKSAENSGRQDSANARRDAAPNMLEDSEGGQFVFESPAQMDIDESEETWRARGASSDPTLQPDASIGLHRAPTAEDPIIITEEQTEHIEYEAPAVESAESAPAEHEPRPISLASSLSSSRPSVSGNEAGADDYIPITESNANVSVNNEQGTSDELEAGDRTIGVSASPSLDTTTAGETSFMTAADTTVHARSPSQQSIESSSDAQGPVSVARLIRGDSFAESSLGSSAHVSPSIEQTHEPLSMEPVFIDDDLHEGATERGNHNDADAGSDRWSQDGSHYDPSRMSRASGYSRMSAFEGPDTPTFFFDQHLAADDSRPTSINPPSSRPVSKSESRSSRRSFDPSGRQSLSAHRPEKQDNAERLHDALGVGLPPSPLGNVEMEETPINDDASLDDNDDNIDDRLDAMLSRIENVDTHGFTMAMPIKSSSTSISNGMTAKAAVSEALRRERVSSIGSTKSLSGLPTASPPGRAPPRRASAGSTLSSGNGGRRKPANLEIDTFDNAGAGTRSPRAHQSPRNRFKALPPSPSLLPNAIGGSGSLSPTAGTFSSPGMTASSSSMMDLVGAGSAHGGTASADGSPKAPSMSPSSATTVHQLAAASEPIDLT